MKESRLLGTLCVCLFTLGIFVTSANAALVQGSVSLGGGFKPVDDSSVPTNLGAATGIAFDNNARVVQGTGDFSALVGNNATMTDFQFSPVLSPNPVPVAVVDGFTFSMDMITVVLQNNMFLLLSGSGTISGIGFDPTVGTWQFSAQTADQTTFSWSSSLMAIPVPPALWLFGTGLLGLVAVARRRKANY